jgi:hypothetical protein
VDDLLRGFGGVPVNENAHTTRQTARYIHLVPTHERCVTPAKLAPGESGVGSGQVSGGREVYAGDIIHLHSIGDNKRLEQFARRFEYLVLIIIPHGNGTPHTSTHHCALLIRPCIIHWYVRHDYSPCLVKFLAPKQKRRGLFSRVSSCFGCFPSGLFFTGRGGISQARQLRLGFVAKIKEKEEVCRMA